MMGGRVPRLFDLDSASVRAYHVGLGLLVLWITLERWTVLRVFYSDDGTLPTTRLRELTGGGLRGGSWGAFLHSLLCVHGYSGGLLWQRALCLLQVALAAMLALGRRPRAAAAASLFLYASATLRNIQLAYILDRYVHILLLAAACLPYKPRPSRPSPPQSSSSRRTPTPTPTPTTTVRSVGCFLFRLEVAWIYWDAGLAKLLAEDGGWSWGAASRGVTPALDSYLRHTPTADFLRAHLLGPRALSFL